MSDLLNRLAWRLLTGLWGDDYQDEKGRCRLPPRWLVLGVNNVCNLHCRMCDVGLDVKGTPFYQNLIGDDPRNMTLALLELVSRKRAVPCPLVPAVRCDRQPVD